MNRRDHREENWNLQDNKKINLEMVKPGKKRERWSLRLEQARPRR